MASKGSARPMGITIIAALSVVGGAFGVLAGLPALGFVGALGGGFSTFLLLALIMSVASIVIGIAFYQLLPWAWNAMVAVTAIGAVVALMNYALVSVVIDAVILYYLFTKVVKSAFKVTLGPTF